MKGAVLAEMTVIRLRRGLYAGGEYAKLADLLTLF